MNLKAERYKQEGDLQNTYSPLRNMVVTDSSGNKVIGDFRTTELELDPEHPVDIECQPSYDGTVNLIINDDKHPPRIVNSRFSKIEDNRFKVINRNQVKQTNLYHAGEVDQTSRLFRNINKIPKIDLRSVTSSGQLKGGTYTFYLRYADEDYNKTDIVAESGQVAIFKGRAGEPKSISGTLLDELTDKAITLKISNLDRSFSKLYIYFSREYSDTNGIRLSTAGFFKEPYSIKNDSENITISGYEEITDISVEDLNIQYNIISATKSQAQVQNMLFFGNVQGVNLDISKMQALSYYIKVAWKQGDSVGYVNPSDYSVEEEIDSEYYNPLNIYYRVGYWPEEIYRLGIVYILKDDSLTPVFNLRGCLFDNENLDNHVNIADLYDDSGNINTLPRDSFLEDHWLDNTYGVFKNPSVQIINSTSVNPLYYQITIDSQVQSELSKLGIKGYFIVRQKRIPLTLAQGYSIGVDTTSYIPMPKKGDKYIAESFIDKSRALTTQFEDRKLTTTRSQCSGLLCVDASSVPTLKSMFDGSEFYLTPTIYSTLATRKNGRHFYIENANKSDDFNVTKGLIYVGSNTPLKYVQGYSFATKCGTAEEVKDFSYFSERNQSKENNKLLRGLYCPFLGVLGNLTDNTVYSIKIPGYSEMKMKDYFQIRANDNSPFYTISDRRQFTGNDTVDIYRGDCFTNTITVRINRNFIDSEVPVNDIIIDADTWKDNYWGTSNMVNGTKEGEKVEDGQGDYTDINRADLNTVPLGMWVTYKCLSNYNLGLRSVDTTHIDEYALMGSPRSFYPQSDITTNVSHKIEESWLLNQGYGATVGQKRYFAATNVPYVQELFDNRIMFSNVQAYGDFQNSYRVFQALDYKDIDRQYGAIVKILSWNNNILAIFEHGVGILPVNEKALLATQSGQSIHMYGAGVLQNQITVISPDFGTIWDESIVQTPLGVYGVDTYAKKIWRVNTSGQMETISDMKIQHYLNDNIVLSEADKYPIVALRNVKTHYNSFKGDVMFTFYNEDKDTSWNICFNERMNKWITRYSWIPLCSENMDNIFVSLDQNRARVLSCIYNNRNNKVGVKGLDTEAAYKWTETSPYSNTLTLTDVTKSGISDTFKVTIKSVDTSYLVSSDKSYYSGADCNINVTIPAEKLTTVCDGKEITLFKVTDPDEANSHTITSCSASDAKLWFKANYGQAIIPAYFVIKVEITWNGAPFTESIGVICDCTSKEYRKAYLRNGFYIHGKAGIFDEINYTDESFNNQILPTKWYDKQEPFEFEFVVNDQIGLHKIFDNLVIISNNVQPSEIEYEFEGDVYNFNKAGIFRAENFNNDDYIWNTKYNKPINTIDPITKKETLYQATQQFANCKVVWDNNLNSYTLLVNQKCKDMKDGRFGRRLGNIQYKEDSWYVTIDPVIFKERFKIGVNEEATFREGTTKTTRIRDKYVKIRVKYTGQDLVIITALKTMLTMSYA